MLECLPMLRERERERETVSKCTARSHSTRIRAKKDRISSSSLFFFCTLAAPMDAGCCIHALCGNGFSSVAHSHQHRRHRRRSMCALLSDMLFFLCERRVWERWRWAKTGAAAAAAALSSNNNSLFFSSSPSSKQKKKRDGCCCWADKRVIWLFVRPSSILLLLHPSFIDIKYKKKKK